MRHLFITNIYNNVRNMSRIFKVTSSVLKIKKKIILIDRKFREGRLYDKIYWYKLNKNLQIILKYNYFQELRNIS